MRSLLLFILIAFSIPVPAQPGKNIPAKKNAGEKQTVSAGITIPVGAFSETHWAGVSLEYNYSHRRFGSMAIMPVKKFGLMSNGGIAYYLGKKEIVSGYSYHYPAYMFIHAYPGVIYNADKHINLQLAAGPALAIYNSTLRFNLGTSLQGSWYINEKWGIEPSLSLMKESIADPLFAVSLKAVMVL